MTRQRDPTVLVLGATGVLGSLVASALESGGWSVLRAGRSLPSRPAGTVESLGFAEADRGWLSAVAEGLAARTVERRGDFVSAARAAIVLLGAVEAGYGPSAPGVYGVEEAFTLDEVRTGLALAGIDIVRQPVTAWT